jgi:hypothetical protein
VTHFHYKMLVHPDDFGGCVWRAYEFRRGLDLSDSREANGLRIGLSWRPIDKTRLCI